jgi:hypothetical protein
MRITKVSRRRWRVSSLTASVSTRNATFFTRTRWLARRAGDFAMNYSLVQPPLGSLDVCFGRNRQTVFLITLVISATIACAACFPVSSTSW